MLARSEYAEMLRRYGCKLLGENREDYHGWGYWCTAWGHHFFVPEIGPEKEEGACPEHLFFEILAELSTLAPR
jgi:hypothetical protein